MKSKKVSKSFLPTDFLNFKKTPIHGVGLGVVLIIIGWLITLGLVTLVGVIIFVPSAGAMVMKYLKKNFIKA